MKKQAPVSPKRVKKPAKSKNAGCLVEKTKHAGGRPSLYNLELAKKICRVISTTTDSLQKMCHDHDFFPASKSTIHEWRIDYPEFAVLYATAKQAQAELLAEEIQEIADFSTLDTVVNPETGQERINYEWVARSRLRVDTRKWIACKLLPKVYGDKNTEEGKKFSDTEKEQLRAIMSELIPQHEREY